MFSSIIFLYMFHSTTLKPTRNQHKIFKSFLTIVDNRRWKNSTVFFLHIVDVSFDTLDTITNIAHLNGESHGYFYHFSLWKFTSSINLPTTYMCVFTLYNRTEIKISVFIALVSYLFLKDVHETLIDLNCVFIVITSKILGFLGSRLHHKCSKIFANINQLTSRLSHILYARVVRHITTYDQRTYWRTKPFYNEPVMPVVCPSSCATTNKNREKTTNFLQCISSFKNPP